jgi:hypothetical protein
MIARWGCSQEFCLTCRIMRCVSATKVGHVRRSFGMTPLSVSAMACLSGGTARRDVEEGFASH